MAKLIEIEDFSAGLITEIEDSDQPENSATDIKNFRIDKLGKLLKESGAKQIDDDSTLPDLPSGFTLKSSVEWEVTNPSQAGVVSTQVTVIYGTSSSGVDQLMMFPYYDPVTTAWITSPGTWFELTEYVVGTIDSSADTTHFVDAALTKGDDYYNTWIFYNFTRDSWSLVQDFTASSDTVELKYAVTGLAASDVYLMERYPLRLWRNSHHEGVNTTDASSNTTTLIDTELENTDDDYYIGWDVYNITRSADATVTDYVGSTQTLTHNTIASQTNGDSYIITKSMFDPESTTIKFIPNGNTLRIMTGSDKGYPDKSDLWLSYINRSFFDDADLTYNGMYLCPKNLDAPAYHYDGIVDTIEETTETTDYLESDGYLINFSFLYDDYQESAVTAPEDNISWESEGAAGDGIYREVEENEKITINLKLNWNRTSDRKLIKEADLFSNRITALRVWMCQAKQEEVGSVRNKYKAESPWYFIKEVGISNPNVILTGSDYAMSSPSGVAFYSPHIYVTDTNNHRILKILASDLSLVSTNGSYGTGNNNYWSPDGIFANSSGDIFISDYNNARIVKVNTDLEYQDEFAVVADHYPRGITGDNTHLYVCLTSPTENEVISKYTEAGVLVTSALGGANPLTWKPYGITVASNYIWVTDYENGTVEYYNDSLTYQSQVLTGFTNPYGVYCGGATLFVVTGHHIDRYDTATYTLGASVGGAAGDGNDEFDSPRHIYSDGTNLYVIDSGNNRIKIHVDPTLVFVRKNGVQSEGGWTLESDNSYTTTTSVFGSDWTAGQFREMVNVMGHTDYKITANAKYGAHVNNRMLVGNVYNEDDKYESFIHISPFNEANINAPDVLPNTRYIPLDSKNILNIQGMVAVVADLVVFGINDLLRIYVGSSSFDWDITDTSERIGCDIPNSIVVVGSHVYFGNTKNDIYIYDLNQVIPITRGKISTTWQGAASTTDFAGYNQKLEEVWFCTGTTAYIYSLRSGGWRKYVSGNTYTMFWPGVNGEMFSGTTGEIYEMSSSAQTESISTEWESKTFAGLTHYRRCRMSFAGTDNFTVKIYNEETGATEATLTFTGQATTKLITKKLSFKARRIQVEIASAASVKKDNVVDRILLEGDPLRER